MNNFLNIAHDNNRKALINAFLKKEGLMWYLHKKLSCFFKWVKIYKLPTTTLYM